jgi:hypothetical protein
VHTLLRDAFCGGGAGISSSSESSGMTRLFILTLRDVPDLGATLGAAYSSCSRVW